MSRLGTRGWGPGIGDAIEFIEFVEFIEFIEFAKLTKTETLRDTIETVGDSVETSRDC